MTQQRWRSLIGLFGLALLSTQVAGQHGPDWPDWAYGLLEPLSSESRVAPPCPDGSRPIDCAYIGAPVPDDGIKRKLPGTDRTFTRNQAYFDYGPTDWYPGDHPPMPAVVAHGKESIGLRACALCHYPNGHGKMENGHVAGLSEGYILQQLQAFAEGTRRSSDPRKANTNEMAMIAANLSDEERRQVAAYYSSTPFRKMVRVIETAEAPGVRTTSNGLMLPVEQRPHVALGARIIEVPENPDRTELSRDPRGLWVAYAPFGSIAAGEQFVTSGGGKTTQCGICHGPGMTGLGDIPSIAGRTASYTMRQLWDFKQGSRQSPIMKPIVENLTAEDMLRISAYLASLEP
jgi:cytochrome c553